MDEKQCISRLLASAVHDMRNVLAVIRESSGLAVDMSSFMKIHELDRGPRLVQAIKDARDAVGRAAAIADGMDFMAQSGAQQEESGCDLGRVCRAFCSLAARQARGARMELSCLETQEPVWTKVPAMEALGTLLDLLDLCASVGGEVKLLLRADARGSGGVVVEIAGGANTELVAAALTASPVLHGMRAGWRTLLTPWRKPGQRFFLSFEPAGS